MAYSGWVPILPVTVLNTKKNPHQQICWDKDLVVWKKNGDYIVQDNACVHRLASLSEGFIDPETKNLCCSYHGYEYNEEGDIVRIPQCNLCTSSISSEKVAKVYPSKIKNGILFMNLASEKEEIPDFSMLSEDYFVRDLPYDYELLIENFMDPSHVPFAHHKLQSTRDLASEVKTKTIEYCDEKIGFEFTDKIMPKREERKMYMSYQKAGSFYQLSTLEPKDAIIKRLNIFCVSVEPGKSRVIMNMEFSKPSMQMMWNMIPNIVKHNRINVFLDSDLKLLQSQQENTLKISSNLTKIINPSDKSVLVFNRWKHQYLPERNNVISFQKETLSRKQLFDHKSQHVENCPQCLSFYENLNFSLDAITFICILYNKLSFAILFFMFRNFVNSRLENNDYIHSS